VEEDWNSTFEEGAMDVKDVVKRVGQKLWLWDKEVLGELKKRIKKAKRIWRSADVALSTRRGCHENMFCVSS
jgi:hypothetical protein